MASKVKALPNEVLVGIFKLVPHETVHQCLFVCKDWTFVAAQEFYKEVSLTGTKMIFIKPTLKLPKDQPEKMIGYGDCVKSLKIHDDRGAIEKLHYTQLTLLFSQLPLLKKIDLSGTNKSTHCLQEIAHIAKSQQQQSNNAVVTTKLQEIEIGYLLLNEKADQYFKTCYAFRSSLALLKLSTLMQELTAEGLTGSYLVFLPHFKNLTHLDVSNDDKSADRASSNLSIQSLVKACPKLTTLTMNSQIPISHYSDTIFDIIILSSAPKDDSIRGILLLALSHQQARNYDKQYPKSRILSVAAPYTNINDLLANLKPNLLVLDVTLYHAFDVWIKECQESDGLLDEFETLCKQLTI